MTEEDMIATVESFKKEFGGGGDSPKEYHMTREDWDQIYPGLAWGGHYNNATAGIESGLRFYGIRVYVEDDLDASYMVMNDGRVAPLAKQAVRR